MTYSTAPVPATICGPGALGQIGREAAALSRHARVLLVADPFLETQGLLAPALAALAAEGLAVSPFTAFTGEPKSTHVAAAAQAGRAAGADLVIGIGGGSALDIAKLATACIPGAPDPMAYALAATPLPPEPLPSLLVPSTAGTGAESCATCIFSGPDGRKLWAWGQELKPRLVLLDPELTVSLPPALTAWCALDAFVHAFEASTSARSHAGAALHAHHALRLIPKALPRAIAAPEDLAAREALLLGAFHAGVAIDNCGTAIAHALSHGAAALAPVHHGLATALGFGVSLRWLVARPTPQIEAAAQACGCPCAAALPEAWEDLVARCAAPLALPEAFRAVTPEALVRAVSGPECAPMLTAHRARATPEELTGFARAMLDTAA
ncbi:iron-containing alcohol dehydrogenase (plasmid) [Paroceanicella profunda]|uniref:Iron-containing alcohol dehydrogenase n=1 Tax=Paroceanicella profunda TaxID=2579971 RepID=A0A5B8FZW0_9RHOB|nr:iron-containing alcohol dehydrogenase [Paroceanicella profunda]QDL94456.1 iron-containing alcohol dehydrogenase [Paroceanicella profunda]